MVLQTRFPCAWLSSSHHAYGSAAWPLSPQIKDGVVLEYIYFQHFQRPTIWQPTPLVFCSYEGSAGAALLYSHWTSFLHS